MLCPYCKIGNCHPGYETSCPDCAKDCVCGCGLRKSLIIRLSTHINKHEKNSVIDFIKQNVHNKKFLKYYRNFIISHYPQYKNDMEKYLVML